MNQVRAHTDTHVLEELLRRAYEMYPPRSIARDYREDPQRTAMSLRRIVSGVLTQPPFEMEHNEKASQLVDEVIAMAIGYGPIDALLRDPQVSEVMINGASHIFYERAGKLYASTKCFTNDEDVLTLLDRIISPLGRRIDERTPMVNARLPEGHRVNAIIPPLSLDGPIVTIRKFKTDGFDLDELVRLGTLPQALAHLLHWLVRSRANIAVTGGTGSGKTTLLNALSHEISSNERIITIEDSAELQFKDHPHVIRLESRPANPEGEGEIPLRMLVINALRMRPDRIVVGEVRGQEALEMLQAMNTGHDGSLTTLHANSPREVAGRLETMVGYGATLPHRLVLAQIASGINYIVHQERLPDGCRRIMQVCHVEGSTDDGLVLTPYYAFLKRGRNHDGSICGVHAFEIPDALLTDLVDKGVATREGVQRWKESLSGSLSSVR